jgi:hypothetical protein
MKLDAIIRLLDKVVEGQTDQTIHWSLPLISTTEQMDPISGLGFRSADDLVDKLRSIRAEVDAGRRTDALALIDGWIGAIKTAERADGW